MLVCLMVEKSSQLGQSTRKIDHVPTRMEGLRPHIFGLRSLVKIILHDFLIGRKFADLLSATGFDPAKLSISCVRVNRDHGA